MAEKNQSTQAAQNKAAASKKVAGIRVIAKRDGFYRAGRPWHGTTEVAKSEFSKEQLQQLKDEDGRMLIVQECQVNAPDDATAES